MASVRLERSPRIPVQVPPLSMGASMRWTRFPADSDRLRRSALDGLKSMHWATCRVDLSVDMRCAWSWMVVNSSVTSISDLRYQESVKSPANNHSVSPPRLTSSTASRTASVATQLSSPRARNGMPPSMRASSGASATRRQPANLM
jgi:hypothetical protein